jgi:hypothetical protein
VSFLPPFADPMDMHSSHPVTVSITDIAAQRQLRIAWNGQRYNEDEFVVWYGEERGVQYWNAAAHYSSVSEMLGTNHFWSNPTPPHPLSPAEKAREPLSCHCYYEWQLYGVLGLMRTP